MSSAAEAISRLRMFAGPNGSGKSTIKSYLPEKLLGKYVNPDEIESEIKRTGFLNLDNFDVRADEAEVLEFFRRSVLLEKAGLTEQAERLKFAANRIDFSDVNVIAYFASVAADFIRRKLVQSNQTLTFETVMSSADKTDFFAEAQAAGYRTYLYFVATESPEINLSRVRIRVKAGGHDVPADKIKSRYTRSLELLWAAIQHANRAYIFDNSGDRAELIAEITDAETIEIKTDRVPAWFVKYVLDKIGNE